MKGLGVAAWMLALLVSGWLVMCRGEPHYTGHDRYDDPYSVDARAESAWSEDLDTDANESAVLFDDADAANAWEDIGYPCTDDCSGHQAGYEWAENEGIDDPDSCGGNSLSFEEGCRAFAEGH